MSHQIRTLYLIHHSHTDIGYTDYQERIVAAQVEHIRKAIRDSLAPGNEGFRWNCETLFCVEAFLKEATDQEQSRFFQLVKENRMGISGSYLNFTDLVEPGILREKLSSLFARLAQEGITVKTAMTADINGISMGQRDALLDNGVEFLFTNIHTHHGMYPLFQNQTAFRWKSAEGKELLVWNGEHYNLGNALGLQPPPCSYYMTRNYFGTDTTADPIAALHTRLEDYLTQVEEEKDPAGKSYPYEFLITSVSGVFSDNAPPSTEILRVIEAYHQRYGTQLQLRMVSLQELYQEIKDQLAAVPVYTGDFNDWWANGVGSTPLAVKHYLAATRLLAQAKAISPQAVEAHPQLLQEAQDNLLLFAEHTWGHSATVSDPYETLVWDLSLRKICYASKAHESASRLLDKALLARGGTFDYYRETASILAFHGGELPGDFPVEFFIETSAMEGVTVTDQENRQVPIQFSPHPRGKRVSFTDHFAPGESKTYHYTAAPPPPATVNTRHAYVGAEGIRDVLSPYQGETCRLLTTLENPWFSLTYRPGEKFLSLWDKKHNRDLLSPGPDCLLTPIYQSTALTHGPYEERRLLGRNIRGKHAKSHFAQLESVEPVEQGPVFTVLRCLFSLEGTAHCEVLLKLFHNLPRLEWALRLAKTLSQSIESIFLPLSLAVPQGALWLYKGGEPFRPGVDQIPGTGMEYWITSPGAVYTFDQGSYLLYTPDTALVYQGDLNHHPITLCQNRPEDNARPLYSWVMNNTWETNFPTDLSGHGEFRYALELSSETTPTAAFHQMTHRATPILTIPGGKPPFIPSGG